MRGALSPINLLPGLLAACLLLAHGCGGGSGTRPPGNSPDPPPDPPPTNEFDLTVAVNAPGGSPLGNVRLQLGGLEAVSGLDGRYTFNDLPEGGYTISLQSPAGDFDCRAIVLASSQTLYEFTLPNTSPGFRVTRVSPALGSGGNPLGGTIRLGLNQAVAPASLSPEAFTITPDIGDFSVSTADSGLTIVIEPRLQLAPNQQLTVVATGDIRSLGGDPLSKPVRWSFRTAAVDASAPRLLGASPASNATGVALNQRLRFEFNETLAADQLSLSYSVTPATAVNVSTDGNLLTLQPLPGWLPNTSYTVSVSNVSDLAGNTSGALPVLRFVTGEQQLISRNIQAEWNRVSDRIVFASDRGGNFDIWSIRPDGSGLTQLTDMAGDEHEPTLAQDGRRLAFQRRAANGLWDIWVASLDSGALGTALPVTPLDFNDLQPQFSRTPSNQLVFVSNRGQTGGLFTMNEDGSSPTELDPAFGLLSTQPAYHPLIDGQLLFSAFSGAERDIWRKSVSIIDGSTVNTNLTAGRLSDEYSPSWGSDASFFVFVSDFDGTPDLWLAEATGEFARQVTVFDREVSDPCASPVAGDNSCVLTLARGDGGSDLVVVSLTSGEIVRNLTSMDGPGT